MVVNGVFTCIPLSHQSHRSVGSDLYHVTYGILRSRIPILTMRVNEENCELWKDSIPAAE
jgi:hypothetical protein